MDDSPQSNLQSEIQTTHSLTLPIHSPRRDCFVIVTLVLLNWAVQIYCVSNPSAARAAFRWGGMSVYWLAGGQWWCPLTSMFLHAGWFHLAANTLFLFLFGRPVERALGHAGVLGLYLTSGLFASLAAWLRIGPLNGFIGASGAVLGLCGAFLFLHFKILAVTKPKGRRRALGWLMVVLIFCLPTNQFLTLMVHALGLVAGFCAMALAWRPRFRLPRTRRWKPQLALAACVIILVLSPLAFYPNPIPLEKSGETAMKRGSFEEALAPLGKLTRFFPDYEWPYVSRIYCYQRLTRRDDALSEADRAIARIPASAALLKQRGVLYLLKGQTQMARDDFDEAYRLDPDDWGTYACYRGRLFLQEGAYVNANKSFSYALLTRQANLVAPSLLGRGLARTALGQLAEAEADWRQILAGHVDTDSRSLIQTYLGFLELRRGHWDEALKWAEQAHGTGEPLPITTLLRLIATEKASRTNSAPAPDAAQVYARLNAMDRSSLKALLTPELYATLNRMLARKTSSNK